MRVIVVEDEDRIREGITGLLGLLEGNFEAAGEAEDGTAGLELIKREKPDIVITDIRMPDMSGLEMLEKVREYGIQSKVIVLSAYSEFEYARQAIRLGVTEYLLKPVSVDEFSRAMNTIKIQIEKERRLQPETLGTLEQILGAVLYGQLEPDEEVKMYLMNRYGLDAGQELVEICIYLGNDYGADSGRAEKVWASLLSQRDDMEYCMIRADYEQALLIVVYHFRDLQEKFELLYSYMDWNLTLGQDVLIAYPKILQIQTSVCIYPIELENCFKAEICLGEPERVKKVIESFHRYFSEGKLYTPRDMKECYVRFIWAVINITKEIDMLDYGNLNQQSILDQVMGAKLFTELKSALEGLMQKVKMNKKNEDAIAHLTVRRVKSMIHEFYQSGITLDEIAAKLNVTPEYLSMQFHREVGETYSSYLKNYRISKAKELLIGTQKKQYEVAKEVGYADSRYFSKVFREYTGYSPAEYRKSHK